MAQAVMDSMCGKWKMIDSETKNFDAFAKAMEFPAELQDKIKAEKEVKYELTRAGDTYSATTTFSYGTDSVTFKLGVAFTSNSMKVEVENQFKVEGNAVLGTHKFMGKETQSKRFLKDGRLIMESTGKGVTMTNVMEKC